MTSFPDVRHLVTWAVIALSVFGVVARPFRWPEATWAVAAPRRSWRRGCPRATRGAAC